MQQNTSKVMFGVGVLALFFSFLIVGVGRAEWRLWPFGTGQSSGASSALSAPLMTEGRTGVAEDQIVRVIREAQPSVASVIITEELPVIEREMETLPFGDGAFRIPRFVQRGTREVEVGGGTAFFVTADGLLLTNKHVVQDAQASYTVLLNDGRKLEAKVAGVDPTNDIALLRVEGGGFQPLSVAPSDELFLGQTAIAIGNALGEFRNTVSVGVVSGLSRSITAGSIGGGLTERLEEIIQTDAAINQGNSGGPLLNARGEVIGMNTAVAAGAQNVGFAIPAPELRRVLQSFQKNGRIVRSYMGVRFIPVTEEVREEYKLASEYGVLLAKGESAQDAAVLPDSPAAKAGLKEGDVLLEMDGKRLTQDVSLLRLIQAKEPGTVVTLNILRDGKEQQVRVTLGEWQEP
ncbi:MAG: trypsin-like peptidase domain-containing protein [Candidatus Peribacteraceae bacterium]|nr:trypsin-like peptidase domain-containing protein [Candidatus Peribacteraceae bacterium]